MTRTIAVICLSACLFYAVGAYAEPLTLELCRAKTIAAAGLLAKEGAAAIEKIKDPNGEFRFADGQGYIWIHNLDGIMVMHPVKPALDGKSLLSIKDVNGFYLFVAMNDVAQAHGSGWVEYSWPKPGEDASSPKVSFVMLVNDEYVVGCGMYDVGKADIKKAFPDDAVYEE